MGPVEGPVKQRKSRAWFGGDLVTATEYAHLIKAVARAEFETGRPMACRHPGAVLSPACCRHCPAWTSCKGFGIRCPGALGQAGGHNDPPAAHKTYWRDIASQINKEDT